MLKTSSDSLFAGLLTNLDTCGFDVRNEHGRGGPGLRRVLEILSSDGVFSARGLLKLSDEEIAYLASSNTGKSYITRFQPKKDENGINSLKHTLEALKSRKKFYQDLAADAMDAEANRINGVLVEEDYTKRMLELSRRQIDFDKSLPSSVSSIDVSNIDSAIADITSKIDSLNLGTSLGNEADDVEGREDIPSKLDQHSKKNIQNSIDKVRENLGLITDRNSIIYAPTSKPKSNDANKFKEQQDHEREVKYQLNRDKYLNVVKNINPKVLSKYSDSGILSITKMIDLGVDVNLNDPLLTELTDEQIEKVFPVDKKVMRNDNARTQKEDARKRTEDSSAVTMDSIDKLDNDSQPSQGPAADLKQQNRHDQQPKYPKALSDKIKELDSITAPNVFKPGFEPKPPQKPPDNSPGSVIQEYTDKLRAYNGMQKAIRQQRDSINKLVAEINALGAQIGDNTLGYKLRNEAIERARMSGNQNEPPEIEYVDKIQVNRENKVERENETNKLREELSAALASHPWGFEVQTYTPRTKEEIAYGVESLNKIKKLVSELDKRDTNHHREGTSIFNRYLGNGRFPNMSSEDKMNSVYIKRIYESAGALYGDAADGEVDLTPKMKQMGIPAQNHKTKSLALSRTPDIDEMLRSAANVTSGGDAYLNDLMRGNGSAPYGRYEGRKVEEELARREGQALVNELWRLLREEMTWGFEQFADSKNEEMIKYFKSGIAAFRRIEQIVADLNSLFPGSNAGDSQFNKYVLTELYPEFGSEIKSMYGGIYSNANTITVNNVRSAIANALSSSSNNSVVIPQAVQIDTPTNPQEQTQNLNLMSQEELNDIDSLIGDVLVEEDAVPSDEEQKVDMDSAVRETNQTSNISLPGADSSGGNVGDTDKFSRPDEPVDPKDVLVLDEFNDDNVSVDTAFKFYDNIVRSLPSNAHNDAYLKAEFEGLRSIRNRFVDWKTGKVQTTLPAWLPDIMVGDARKFQIQNDGFYTNNKDAVDQYKELMDDYVESMRDFQFVPAQKGRAHSGIQVYKSSKSTSPDAKVFGGQILSINYDKSIGVIYVDEKDGDIFKSSKNTGWFAVELADGSMVSDADGVPYTFEDMDAAEAYKEEVRKSLVKQEKHKLIRHTEHGDGMFVGASQDGKKVFVLRPALGADGKPYSKVEKWDVADYKVSISDAQAEKFTKKSMSEQPKEGDYISVNGGQPAKITKLNPDGKTVMVDNNGSQAVADLTQPSTEVVVNMNDAAGQQQTTAPVQEQGVGSQQATQTDSTPGQQTMQQQQTSNGGQVQQQSPMPGTGTDLNIPTITPGPNMTLSKSYS